VRDLFEQAKKQALIFIDELDAIGKSRIWFYGGNDEARTNPQPVAN